MLRTLIVSSYPPDRCGIAKYTVQFAAARREDGEHVEIVSTKRSAAQHQADLRTWHGLLSALVLSYRFDRTVVQFFPDLLFKSTHTRQFLPHWPWLALFLAAGRNVELIAHEAPYDVLAAWPTWRGRVMRALWRRLFTVPKHTYVHTDWERDEMVRATGIAPRRVELLAHGSSFIRRTDLDRDAARAELGLQPHGYHFLAIGFIQPHKGFDRAVRALARLEGARARVHVVGSVRVNVERADRYLMSLRELIDETPGADLRLQFVSDEEFDQWIVACDAVVLPYRRIVSSGVLERAKLYGRPAIVTDVGGMRDQAGESAIVVADDDELAAAMARLAGVEVKPDDPADDADPRRRLARGAERLRLRFDAGDEEEEPKEAPWQPTPALGVPEVRGRTRLHGLLKRVIRKLTWWELQPIVRAAADLREAVISQHWELERARALIEVQRAPRLEVRDGGAFYAAQQAAFRGPEQDVSERLRVYLPRIRAAAGSGAPIVDIGSGRGEWLMLLGESGIEAYGVDINPEFVRHSKERGLRVNLQDGLEHLRSVAPDSLAAITSFHLVESLPPEVVVELLDAALRALRPGGLILLETPNVADQRVGASTFWLDPTHVRPFHPELLRFLLEQRGFVDVTLELHNPRATADTEEAQASQDVAAIGRKRPLPD